MKEKTTETGRVIRPSISEPAIQNIPLRTEIGRSIRDAFQQQFGTRVELDLDTLLDDLPSPYRRTEKK